MSPAIPLLVRDFLDGEDLYNLSMGVVAQRWPDARVRYRYVNRDPEHAFRRGFAEELRAQIEQLAELSLSQEMFDFFRATAPWLPRNYLQWLRQYRFDPAAVEIRQQGGRLEMEVRGAWYEAIYWEVKLLSLASELSHVDPGTGEPAPLQADWEEVIREKAERLSEAGVQWIDFGTRRRFSFQVQDAVVRIMKDHAGFRGTSNPYLAMRHGVKAVGTYAHQLVMAMQALYGPLVADRMAMEHWVEVYRGNLGTALSDTLTTEHFLRFFDSYYANLFTGVRQDSGDPFAFGERLIEHYHKLGIDPTTKLIVFSDALDTERAIALHRHFQGRIRTTMGIGTHLTADARMTGVKPLNNVIKLVEADFGSGPVPLVKLSDDRGKALGDPELVAAFRQVLRLT